MGRGLLCHSESVADIERRRTLVCLKEIEVFVAMFVGAEARQSVHCPIASAWEGKAGGGVLQFDIMLSWLPM